MFVDEVVVNLKSGDGGDGCMSFRREKYIPKGGPNGGDGGNGGDVIICCERNMNDLTPYRFKNHYRAANGDTGQGSNKHGKNGENCIIKVPPGTVIYDCETGRPVLEMVREGHEVVLLKGGKGGLGNVHFKSSTNQSPRQTIPGEKGLSGEYRFVLKVIADVGLVGFPNAGKSSLIKLLTHADQKVGAYPFTTLNPKVGVMEYGDNYERITIADIPGLIEGASENKGLGHRFLKHIERCRLLLFLIDMGSVDMRNPVEDYKHLLNELKAYDSLLCEKNKLIVANKMDLEVSPENLRLFREKVKEPVLEVSCLTGQGIEDLKSILLKAVKDTI